MSEAMPKPVLPPAALERRQETSELAIHCAVVWVNKAAAWLRCSNFEEEVRVSHFSRINVEGTCELEGHFGRVSKRYQMDTGQFGKWV